MVKNMSKKILLVSLVHNRKALVGKALQSAVNQTLPKNEWTHLVIDNASTDGADQVVEVFIKKYPHMAIARMVKNLGQQKAFNYVLDEWIPKNMPDAEIMANLDSDDELMPNALEEVKGMFYAHPKIGATYSGFALIDKKGNYMVKDHGKAKMVPNQFTPQGQLILRRMFVASNPCGHLRAFRISALRDVGGFNTNYEFSTDYNVFGRILTKYPVVKINKVLYKFRQHGNQVQGKKSPQQTKDWKDMQKEFRELWTKKGLI
jgi:glycosyltransferase involved in cell wall biosynthesis